MDLLSRLRSAVLLGALLGLVLPVWPHTTSFAQLSPGPLQKSHEALEGLSRCTQCHTLGKGIESERCLECHEPLRRRIAAGKGLHARSGYETCIECHSDHQGRDYQMIRWPGPQTEFSHEDVGYELRRAHAILECRQCHRAERIANPAPLRDHGKDLDRTFLGLETECTACHQDKHESTLGADCTRCHDEGAWKPAPKFDHASTKYPLLEKHSDVPCTKCHPSTPRFPELSFAQCTDCHKDPHAGVLGADCARCHSPAGWAQVMAGEFDHGTTKFPLVGAHQKVRCARCHVSGQSVQNRLFCDQCHVDQHQGVFFQASVRRTDCTRCHNSERFVPSTYGFASHADSRYPLTGAHRAVPCAECHRPQGKPEIYRWSNLNCASCHRDLHADSFRQVANGPEPCAVCHRTESWTEIEFSHDAAEYRLEGAHSAADCVDCHSSSVRKAVVEWERIEVVPMLTRLAVETSPGDPGDEAEAWSEFLELVELERRSVRTAARGDGGPALRLDDAPTACAECHRNPHGSQFDYLRAEWPRTDDTDPAGTFCARCHDSRSWRAGRFDHEEGARFSLAGAHEKVHCSECHRRDPDGAQRFRPLGTECRDCHATPPRTDR